MYKCLNCNSIVNELEVYHETHGSYYLQPENLYVCPYCGSENVENAVYCNVCDEPTAESELDYGCCKECNDNIKKKFAKVISENFNSQELDFIWNCDSIFDELDR